MRGFSGPAQTAEGKVNIGEPPEESVGPCRSCRRHLRCPPDRGNFSSFLAIRLWRVVLEPHTPRVTSRPCQLLFELSDSMCR